MEPASFEWYVSCLVHPFQWPSWAFVAAATWHLLVTGRRGLAFQFLCASWYAALLFDLFGLAQFAYSLVGPSGCGNGPTLREIVIAIHVPHAALATLTLPLAALCRRSLRWMLCEGGGLAVCMGFHVILLIHLTLCAFTTRFGTFPSMADYVRSLAH